MFSKKIFYLVLLLLAGCSPEDNSIDIDSANLNLSTEITNFNTIIECGTVSSQRGARSVPANYSVPSDEVTFGLTIHVVRDDNGENPVLNSTQIENIAPALNAYFHNVKYGIQSSLVPVDFINFSENIIINYIDNSDFFYVDRFNTNDPDVPNLHDFWTTDRDPTRLNIYFTKRVLNAVNNLDNYVNGIASYSDIQSAISTDRFLDNDARRESVMAHEIGHNFGLYHTFDNVTGASPFCVANANYSETLGDFVLDTPFNGNYAPVILVNCVANIDNYNEWEPVDLCGEPVPFENYNFLAGNFMSRENADCRENFTVGQFIRMRYIYGVSAALGNLDSDIDGTNSGSDDM